MSQGFLALMRSAVSRGDVEAAQSIVKEMPRLIDYRYPAGDSWMHVAAANGRADMVRWLAEQGLNVNQLNKDKHRPVVPLWVAFTDGGSPSTIKTLLEIGARPDVTVKHETLLGHIMAYTNLSNVITERPLIPNWESDLVLALLKYGADPNHADHTGFTPLHNAAHFGKEESTLLLISHGGNPHIKIPIDGRDAFDVAKDNNYHTLVERMRAWENACKAHKVAEDALKAERLNEVSPL